MLSKYLLIATTLLIALLTPSLSALAAPIQVARLSSIRQKNLVMQGLRIKGYQNAQLIQDRG
jgi:hypothetical protein